MNPIRDPSKRDRHRLDAFADLWPEVAWIARIRVQVLIDRRGIRRVRPQRTNFPMGTLSAFCQKTIERSLHIARCAADQQDVAIAKVVLVIVVEILVGDIATAGDDDRSIHDERLVVHPLVEAAEIGREVEESWWGDSCRCSRLGCTGESRCSGVHRARAACHAPASSMKSSTRSRTWTPRSAARRR